MECKIGEIRMTYEGTKKVVDTLVKNNKQTEAIEHLLKEVQRLHWVCRFWLDEAEKLEKTLEEWRE